MDRFRDRITLGLVGLGFLVALGWADDAGIFRAAARGDAGYADKLILVVSAAFALSLGFRRAERAGRRTGEVSAIEGAALWAAGLAWALLPAHGTRFDVVAGVLALLLTHQLATALASRRQSAQVDGEVGPPAARDVPAPVHTPLGTELQA